MKTARLTIDGAPIVSAYKERRIRRRKADIQAYEAKREHQLTANALVAAIMAIENGDRSESTLQALRAAAIRAEKVTQ